MKILLVAATKLETKGLREKLKMKEKNINTFFQEIKGQQIELLHTGIGMVNTSFFLGEYLANNSIDLAINFGIAGSFDRNFELGDVVEIVSEEFPELGAESPEGFLDLEKLGFPLMEETGEMTYNRIVNPFSSKYDLPKVKGITVNKVHGLANSIKQIEQKWNPQVESMEGGAFFHAMKTKKIPFLAFRSLSNYVEVRNKANWKIGLSVQNVQNFVFRNTLEGWI